jgi:adenylate cyclase
MFFVLIVCMTAFRMNPWLSAFAGIATSLALVVAYFAWLAPHLTEEMLQTNPALAAPAVLSRAIVLLTAGAACAIASSAMRRHLAATEKDKTRIELMERTFGRLLAPEVARRILENDDWMKPERRDAVVMFADLQGFTKYSETKDPEDIAEYLNVCWGKAAEIVESHGGVINKYLGDGFLALFGVPVPLEDPESAAAHTATALQEALTPLLEKEGLGLCIGIHAGPLIFGGIGSENRCEFTVVGTTVNVASRVESLNRTLETRNLTTSVVADKLGEKWSLSPRGDHRVKGIGSAFGVFELGSAKLDETGEKT